MNTFVLGGNAVRSLLTAGDEQPSWPFILNILLPESPLAASPITLGITLLSPSTWDSLPDAERDLNTTQEGRIDAKTHSGTSVNPSLLLLLSKLPVASSENLSHGTLQIPRPLTNASLLAEVMTKQSKTFFGCPKLSDLLSQQHLLANEIVSQKKNEIKCQGLDQSSSDALRYKVKLQVKMRP